MSYLATLQAQMEVMAWWKSDASISTAERMRAMLLQRDGGSPSAPNLRRMLYGEVANADPYFVGAPICAMLERSASEFPTDASLTLELLPTTGGFVVFENPLPLSNGPEDDVLLGLTGPLGALSWEGTGVLSPSGNDATSVLSVTFYDWNAKRPSNTALWPFGDAWGEPWAPAKKPHQLSAAEIAAHNRMGESRRYFLMLLQFMAQEVVAVGHGRAQNKSTKRRAIKTFGHDPIVRVVMLRRLAQHHSDHEGVEATDWSCQWIVRGHWRRQWYPSQGVHQPKWIMPYVKGPDDKPLKQPRAQVFAVVR